MKRKFIKFSDISDGKFNFAGIQCSLKDAANNNGYFVNCMYWISHRLRSCLLINVKANGIDVRIVNI